MVSIGVRSTKKGQRFGSYVKTIMAMFVFLSGVKIVSIWLPNNFPQIRTAFLFYFI